MVHLGIDNVSHTTLMDNILSWIDGRISLFSIDDALRTTLMNNIIIWMDGRINVIVISYFTF